MKHFSELKQKEGASRKKPAVNIDTTAEKEKDNAMEIEGKIVKMLRYNELP